LGARWGALGRVAGALGCGVGAGGARWGGVGGAGGWGGGEARDGGQWLCGDAQGVFVPRLALHILDSCGQTRGIETGRGLRDAELGAGGGWRGEERLDSAFERFWGIWESVDMLPLRRAAGARTLSH